MRSAGTSGKAPVNRNHGVATTLESFRNPAAMFLATATGHIELPSGEGAPKHIESWAAAEHRGNARTSGARSEGHGGDRAPRPAAAGPAPAQPAARPWPAGLGMSQSSSGPARPVHMPESTAKAPAMFGEGAVSGRLAAMRLACR